MTKIVEHPLFKKDRRNVFAYEKIGRNEKYRLKRWKNSKDKPIIIVI